MNRKEFIKFSAVSGVALYGLASCQEQEGVTPGRIPLSTDTHNLSEIKYLLRRTTFGVTSEQLKFCQKIGLYKTIDLLLTDQKLPEPPVNFEFEKDVYTPIGTTWVDKPYLKKTFFEQYRKKSLQAWIAKSVFDNDLSVREQMTLFWHNHYGVSDIVEHKYEYIHNQLLRKYALGNYKELTKQVTIDPAMLRFLSGFDNINQAPNENYARELLELFTVGKGEMITEGHYTNYKEEDVRQIAKVLTGWKDVGWYSFYKNEPVRAEFLQENHDNTEVRLSECFEHRTIPALGEKRYEYLIEILFEKTETAKFICRKLYRWFVNHEITNEIEDNLIEPLSVLLMKNDYEIKPVLKTLLRSRHFYAPQKKKLKIKNPYEYVFGTIKYFLLQIPESIQGKYNIWHELFLSASSMGMEYFKPPSVAGWKAYYQSPLYYETWINAATLQNRKIFNDKLLKEGLGISGIKTGINYRLFLSAFADDITPDALVQKIVEDLFAIPLSERDKKEAITLMLNGWSEREWCSHIVSYQKENSVIEKDNLLEEGLKKSLSYLLDSPEYNFV